MNRCLYGVPVRVSSTLICRLFVFVQIKFFAMSLLTKHSAEEWVYLRKYVKYDAAQKVEMNHNDDSLFMEMRMDYCCVWFITQNVWSRFQTAAGQSSFCVWAADQTKSTRFSSHLVLFNVRGPQIFQAVRRAEEVSLRRSSCWFSRVKYG